MAVDPYAEKDAAMPFPIAILLIPLLLALSPAAASPQAAEGPLEIMAYPPGETPDTVPVRDLGGLMQMQPGESRQLVVGTVECCYVFVPGEVDVIWTVSPIEGVTISDRGLLTVSADVPDGTIFTVAANRDPVGPSASLRVHVYTPEAQPLVGLWHEEAQIACGTAEVVAPETRIGELRFGADGTFSVTWHPFEIFVDYWGMYEADREAGTLTLVIEGSMGPTPEDFDGEGRFEVRDDGSLALEGIWLGTPPGREAATPACGHVFTAW
jgi:hypothetical protein